MCLGLVDYFKRLKGIQLKVKMCDFFNGRVKHLFELLFSPEHIFLLWECLGAAVVEFISRKQISHGERDGSSYVIDTLHMLWRDSG